MKTGSDNKAPTSFLSSMRQLALPTFAFSKPSKEPSRGKIETPELYEPKPYVPIDEWIEKTFYDPTTVRVAGAAWDYTNAKLLRLHPSQSKILRAVLTPDHRGLFPYSTILYSTIKKEGKTTLASAVASWFAEFIEPPNLILCLANNQEQSAGRIFGNALPTLYKLGYKVPMSQTSKPEVKLENGTIIQAIPNNYAGQAGANYGLTLWSELWAYTTETSRRLYEELVPVPTRKNSIRWIETYAGFEDESDQLLSVFKRIFTDVTESTLQPGVEPVPGLEDIQTEGRPACYHIPSERLFVYWNHTPRMPWNTGIEGEKFRAMQKADMRHSQYVRLWENRWQSSAGDFIPETWWLRSLRIDGPQPKRMIFAVDASQRNDTTSLVGVYKHGNEFVTGFCKVWVPGGKDIDLEETVSAELLKLWQLGLVEEVWYDPFQMHQVAINLRKKGMAAVYEFNQGVERTLADTLLYQCYKEDRIVNFDHDQLHEHLTNAKARELKDERLRLEKGTMSNSGKIDAAVSQSMAVYKCNIFDRTIRCTSTTGLY